MPHKHLKIELDQYKSKITIDQYSGKTLDQELDELERDGWYVVDEMIIPNIADHYSNFLLVRLYKA